MINSFGSLSRSSPSRFWFVLVLASCAVLCAVSAEAQAPAAPPPAQPGAAPAPAPGVAPADSGLAAPPPAGYAQPAPYGQPVPYAQPAPYGQPYYAQPYAPPPRRQRPFRPRRGLMVAGISMLAATYMVAIVSGAVMLDMDREECAHCKDVGPLLFIPWVGPFAAISQADEGDGMLALLGALQLGGAALTIGGVVVYFKSKKRAEEQGLISFDLREGRTLALDLDTSPLRFGPAARLRF